MQLIADERNKNGKGGGVSAENTWLFGDTQTSTNIPYEVMSGITQKFTNISYEVMSGNTQTFTNVSYEVISGNYFYSSLTVESYAINVRENLQTTGGKNDHNIFVMQDISICMLSYITIW